MRNTFKTTHEASNGTDEQTHCLWKNIHGPLIALNCQTTSLQWQVMMAKLDCAIE